MQYYIPISTYGGAAVDGQISKSFVDWITVTDTVSLSVTRAELTRFTGRRKYGALKLLTMPLPTFSIFIIFTSLNCAQDDHLTWTVMSD